MKLKYVIMDEVVFAQPGDLKLPGATARVTLATKGAPEPMTLSEAKVACKICRK